MKVATIQFAGEPIVGFTKKYIEYVKNVKARSSNTVTAYSQDLNCFMKYLTTENVCFPELSEDCVTSYLKFLRYVLQLKPATVRRRLLTLQGFCQWLVASNWIKYNPFDGISLDLKVPKRLPRPVDPLVIRQLILQNRQMTNRQKVDRRDWTSRSRVVQKQTTMIIIQLMLTTGIRVGEVTAIRVRDISTDGKSIHIIGKGDKERLVYIENAQFAEVLSQYRCDRISSAISIDNLFLNGRGRCLTTQTIRKRVKSMCLNIGTCDTPTPHRFRHSAATLLIENGADIRVVQRLLGHASISTTELYTQVSDVSLREALRKADVLSQFQ